MNVETDIARAHAARKNFLFEIENFDSYLVRHNNY